MPRTPNVAVQNIPQLLLRGFDGCSSQTHNGITGPAVEETELFYELRTLLRVNKISKTGDRLHDSSVQGIKKV
jgi:hypothetical protein